MNKLVRLWKGEAPLESAFWNWAVLGGLIVNASSSALFLILIADDRPVLALFFGYALSVPYNVIAAVGVWCAAGRYTGERKWADLARIVTLVGMVLLSVT